MNAEREPNPIEGVWMELIWETESGVRSVLPRLPSIPGEMTLTTPYIWRISKHTLEKGPDEKDRFPRWRYTYKLNPNNQEGAIDIIPLDEDKDKKKKGKAKTQLAIYFVKDDYLMICFGRDSRPKSFTSSKDNPNWVYILRRSKLKSADPDAAKPNSKDK